MRTIPGRWLGALWAASGVATLCLLADVHEHVIVRAPAAIAILSAMLLAAAVRYDLRDGATPARRCGRDLAEYWGLFAAIALIGAIASYPDAAMSAGFADASLYRIDRAIGFDWPAWYRVVAAHRTLQLMGRLAYQSIFVSPAILLAHYARARRTAEARSFLLAFWIAMAATLLLFPHVAAVGPLAYAWRGPIPYLPISALYQAQLIPALRSHALASIDPGVLRGLVEAPSFHAASAIVYAAYAWREPRLRAPFAIVNAAMLLATPIEGTHYLIDIILGAGVGGLAVAAAARVTRLRASSALAPADAPAPALRSVAQATVIPFAPRRRPREPVAEPVAVLTMADGAR